MAHQLSGSRKDLEIDIRPELTWIIYHRGSILEFKMLFGLTGGSIAGRSAVAPVVRQSLIIV